MTRVLSGVISIPIVVGIVYYGSPWLFFALVAAAVLIGSHEFFTMVARTGVDGFPRLGSALGILLLLCFYFEGRYFLEWGVVALVSLFIAWYVGKGSVKVAIDQIAYTLLGVFYVAGLSGYFLLIRGLEGGKHFVFFLFLLIWIGDTAAYYVGRNFGKRPLAPEISPGKTIEGAVGGLVGSLIGATLAKFWFLAEISLFHCLIVGLICGIIGQFGDLAESLIKRNTGVKDSGRLIPGHGGILDRIDGLMFAGPAFYFYYKLFL